MKKLYALLFIPVIAGCLTAKEGEFSSWAVEYVGPTESGRPRQGVARIANVSVRMPWERDKLAVKRADGSLAFDSYNEYAANPSSMIKGAVFDAMKARGPFEHVVGQSSIATASMTVEVLITQLYLDCSEEGKRIARARLTIRCVSDRQIASVTTGSADIEMTDGNYGAALSKAVTESLLEAIEKIR